MNTIKAYTLTVLLSTLTFAQESHATTIAPPVEAQVQQVAQWFTGLFNNAEQVASNPAVPFISMSNCAVQLAGGNLGNDTRNVYLEQQSVAFNRVRFYSFSPADSGGVQLSVRSFINPSLLSGICSNPEPQRIVNFNNIVGTSCNLLLTLQDNRYLGTNAPIGCPIASGGKVVSNIFIGENTINSLDRIFDARGNVIVATPIELRRVNSIPEPSFTFGLLAIVIGYTGLALSGKRKQQSIQKQKTPI